MFRAMRNFGMDRTRRASILAEGDRPGERRVLRPLREGVLVPCALERAVGRPAFDRFAREYIGDHRFQSLTTEAFVDYLRRKLPAAARAVDVRAWLYEPGFPDDAPTFPPPLADAVSERLFDYQDGAVCPAGTRWPDGPRRKRTSSCNAPPADSGRGLPDAGSCPGYAQQPDRGQPVELPRSLHPIGIPEVLPGSRPWSAPSAACSSSTRSSKLWPPRRGHARWPGPFRALPRATPPDHRAGDGAGAHPARAVTWRRPTKRRLTASKTCRTISPIPTVGISAQ